MSTTRQKIDEGNATWIKCFETQDSELLASVFHENGAILGSDGKIIKGRENVKEYMANWMHQIGPSKFTINTIDVYEIDDDIYEKGSYTLTISNGTYHEGKFVVVWKHEDNGRLYFYRDIGM